MLSPNEYAELNKELDDVILKGCETDAQYFERLCYALQHISRNIYQFKEDFYEEAE